MIEHFYFRDLLCIHNGASYISLYELIKVNGFAGVGTL